MNFSSPKYQAQPSREPVEVSVNDTTRGGAPIIRAPENVATGAPGGTGGTGGIGAVLAVLLTQDRLTNPVVPTVRVAMVC